LLTKSAANSRRSGGGAAVGADFSARTGPYRRELTAQRYRMTGSPQAAGDLVRERLLRARQAYDRFDGRSSMRTWLRRIATNTRLGAPEWRQRPFLDGALVGEFDLPAAL
jgi:RNA polymerase sigma-70 factor (ECF subfamily)